MLSLLVHVRVGPTASTTATGTTASIVPKQCCCPSRRSALATLIAARCPARHRLVANLLCFALEFFFVRRQSTNAIKLHLLNDCARTGRVLDWIGS